MTEIEIVDVGPRDGLQNEKTVFETADKLELIRQLIDAGSRRLEVASFVNPKRVPQMADAEAVIAGLPARDDVTYIGLVLNDRGYDRALEAGIDEVGLVICATDEFGRRNQKQTTAENVTIVKQILARAKADGMPAQVTISLACGCPFEGEVAPERIIAIAEDIATAGPIEISLADTIGVGVPGQVHDLFTRVGAVVGDIPLRAHFHNTRNTGVANAWAAVNAGAKTVDASIAGLGGCPFAPNATGNIGTEDLVYMLERSGVSTGLSLTKLIDTAHWVGDKLGRKTPAMVSHAGGFPKGEAA